MYKNLLLVTILFLNGLTSVANDKVVDPETMTMIDIQHRMRALERKIRIDEEKINLRKELVRDTSTTSGYAKVAWLGSTTALTIWGGTLAAATTAGAVQFALDAISFARFGQTVGSIGVAAAGASALGAIAYVNYETGAGAYADITGANVSDIKLKQVDTLLVKQFGDLRSYISLSPREQLERLNLVRNELALMEDSVFENQLNGSTWNTIKDHVLAGTVAAEGTLALLQIAAGQQALDLSELNLLKNLSNR